MALNKTIKTKNGVNLSYHRIALVNIQINSQITILVKSYVDESSRVAEKNYFNGMLKEDFTIPYTQDEYISFMYDERSDMFKGNVVQKAYNWLKTQEKFKGSTDILEV